MGDILRYNSGQSPVVSGAVSPSKSVPGAIIDIAGYNLYPGNYANDTGYFFNEETACELLRQYGLRATELLRTTWDCIMSNDRVLINGSKRSRSRLIVIPGATAAKEALPKAFLHRSIFSCNYRRLMNYMLNLGIVRQPDGYKKRIITHVPRHELAEAVQSFSTAAKAGEVLGHRSASSIKYYPPPPENKPWKSWACWYGNGDTADYMKGPDVQWFYFGDEIGLGPAYSPYGQSRQCFDLCCRAPNAWQMEASALYFDHLERFDFSKPFIIDFNAALPFVQRQGVILAINAMMGENGVIYFTFGWEYLEGEKQFICRMEGGYDGAPFEQIWDLFPEYVGNGFRRYTISWDGKSHIDVAVDGYIIPPRRYRVMTFWKWLTHFWIFGWNIDAFVFLPNEIHTLISTVQIGPGLILPKHA